jgi:polysaccharide export outer membrane protein
MKAHLMCIAGALSLVAGCVHERRSDPQAAQVFRPATERDVSATEYRVAPPDKLFIRAAGIKELDQQVALIRPDGKIQVNLLGEFYVAGRTPQEIGQSLTRAGAPFYNDPQIQVDVAEYNSKFYCVFGTAVRDGGRKPYTGRNTVVAALAAAGFTDDAWPQQVSLSRPAKGAQPRATAIIDMTQVFLHGDTSQNFLIEEGDVIYVPDGPLADFSKTVRKVLSPLTVIAGTAGTVTPTAAAR